MPPMFNHLKSYPERGWEIPEAGKIIELNIYNPEISIYKWLSIAIVDSSLMFTMGSDQSAIQ